MQIVAFLHLLTWLQNRVSAKGADVILLDPLFDAVQMEDVLMVAVQLSHGPSVFNREMVHADSALLDVHVLGGVELTRLALEHLQDRW